MTSFASRLRRVLTRVPSWMVLSIVVVLGYAATSVGELSPDPETRYRVAESIAREGDLSIDRSHLTVDDADGTSFSVFFPGQTVTFLPVAGAVELGRRAVDGDPQTFRQLGDFAAALLLVPFMAAIAVVGHVVLLRDLGVRPRVALTSGALLAFATQQWVWGTAGTEEVSLGACTIWAFVHARRALTRLADATHDATVRRRVIRHLGIGGVLVACGLVHRGTALATAVGYVALTVPPLLAHRAVLGRVTLGLVPWVSAAVAIVALVPLYNWARFGDPLDTGYATYYAELGGVWATPLLTGVAGHLVSPGKSIFLYTPWLLLLMPALGTAGVRRRLGTLTIGAAALLAVHLLLYSKHTFWSGAFGFGIRFHVCVMPLLLVPIAVWLDERFPSAGPERDPARRRVPAWIAALAALSVGVQALGLTLNTGYEYLADRTAYDEAEPRIARAAAWDPSRSPLVVRARAVVRKIGGADILPPGEPESKRIQASWNVFPVRAHVMLGPGPRTTALWMLWAALLVAAAGAGLWLVHRIRSAPTPAPTPDPADPSPSP